MWESVFGMYTNMLHGGEVFRSVAGPKLFYARVFYERGNTLMFNNHNH